MAAVRYFDLVREMRDAYNHRLRLVQSARAIGVKPTARLFATTVPTVRKWLRRYQLQGRSGLREHSRAPHACPHKTSPAVEQQVIALRQKLPTFGAARLQREFDLPVSHMAMQRIWRAHGLLKKRQKKYRRKQDLAALKATWALF
jgi:transposase